MGQSPPVDRKSIAIDSLGQLDKAGQMDVMKKAGLLPDPNPPTVNYRG